MSFQYPKAPLIPADTLFNTTNLGAPFANVGPITTNTGFVLNVFNNSSSSITAGILIQVTYLII